ncbi:MAG TPA: hypothetical protein VIX87_02010, partial [Steroidobacteraceae bacterium]
ANLWRISDDFWDTWPLLVEQFERLKNWSAYQRPGSWPDADMLPLGTLELGRRETRFTPDEQVTLMTLWTIARSPLMIGADLVTLDDATLALLTNDEVLAVNQASRGGREVYRRDNLVVWQARSAHDEVYVAHFNLNDAAPDATAVPVPIQLTEVGMSAPVRVRDLWQRTDLASAGEVFAPPIPAHGAGLYRLSAA